MLARTCKQESLGERGRNHDNETAVDSIPGEDKDQRSSKYKMITILGKSTRNVSTGRLCHRTNPLCVTRTVGIPMLTEGSRPSYAQLKVCSHMQNFHPGRILSTVLSRLVALVIPHDQVRRKESTAACWLA